MDKLANRLHDDAQRIDVDVSAELDERLRASIGTARARSAGDTVVRKPLASIGWASALTGVAVAAAVIFVVNVDRLKVPNEAPPPFEVVSDALPQLNAETAVFTAPLTEELENLEADLRKAEQAVRREIGLGM